MIERGRLLTREATDRLFEIVTQTARRFDEAIPARQMGKTGEEMSPAGIQNLIRRYEWVLAQLTEDPETAVLEELSDEEIRDIAFYAARTGNAEALHIILEQTGLDLAVRDESGMTMLDHAQRERQYAVAHYLISRGAGREEHPFLASGL